MPLFLTIFLALSVLFSTLNSTSGLLAPALFEGAKEGVSLAITLAGPLCLWCGLSYMIEQTGAGKGLAKVFSPVMKRLFPVAWKDFETQQALCGNLSANLLGLGSAATPLGIRAACRMAEHADGQASIELCKLIVMNTASVQLIPSTVAAVRAGLGSAAPFDILPAVWITSLCSVTAGLLAAKVFSKWC